MSGWTPVFDSVFEGSLCGKYPDLPVWLVLLAKQQRGGIIDAHPSYLAAISGIPQADIEAAIARFCQPDPESRTPDHDGRRLEPLPNRGFGWRILNHENYRQKARKQEISEQEVESGKNAERMRVRRAAKTGRDRTRPDETGPDRPSESYSESLIKDPRAVDKSKPVDKSVAVRQNGHGEAPTPAMTRREQELAKAAAENRAQLAKLGLKP